MAFVLLFHHHLFIDILYAVHSNRIIRLAEVEALWNVEDRLLAVWQCPVGIYLLHEVSPYRQSHRRTLSQATGIEVNVT